PNQGQVQKQTATSSQQRNQPVPNQTPNQDRGQNHNVKTTGPQQKFQAYGQQSQPSDPRQPQQKHQIPGQQPQPQTAVQFATSNAPNPPKLNRPINYKKVLNGQERRLVETEL